MQEEISYDEAYKELQEIVSQLEHAEISIDELNKRMKRAAELLKICKDKLFTTEKNIQDVLEEIRSYSAE